MSNCTTNFHFTKLKKREVIAKFGGGCVTSDAGGLLLREAEKKLNLIKKVSEVIPDHRDQSKIDHSIETMIMQRVFGIALGNEDLNDHNTLRNDILFQTMAGKDSALASSPTLCRFENLADGKIAFKIHEQIVETFIQSHNKAPQKLVLDFDSTDDLVHGTQLGRFFHGYYGNYCFLPLYVFCGKKLLVSCLRQASVDGAFRADKILKLLVMRFRQVWPNVDIVFRGDGGFCRHEMFDWCETNNVFYITGITRNSRLEEALRPSLQKAEEDFKSTKTKQRIFTEFKYAAGSWKNERKIIGKAEFTEKGANPRFIVTNLPGNPQDLYDNDYCERGNMENRIKENQLCLYADRTSCHEWWPNQLRLLFSSMAYILVEHIRSTLLVGTELENAQVDTIRLKLFKIGAIVIRNTRKILFMMSSHYPYQKVFAQAVELLFSP